MNLDNIIKTAKTELGEENYNYVVSIFTKQYEDILISIKELVNDGKLDGDTRSGMVEYMSDDDTRNIIIHTSTLAFLKDLGIFIGRTQDLSVEERNEELAVSTSTIAAYLGTVIDATSNEDPETFTLNNGIHELMETLSKNLNEDFCTYSASVLELLKELVYIGDLLEVPRLGDFRALSVKTETFSEKT